MARRDENMRELAQLLRNMGLTSVEKIRTFVESKDPNRRLNYMLFEYAVAIKYGAWTWASIQPDIKKAWNAPIIDSGIDCVGDDFKHVIQAKWRKPKNCIPFKQVATFHTLGDTIGATRFTIVTSERVTITKTRPRCVEHAIIGNAEFVDILSTAVRCYDELKDPDHPPAAAQTPDTEQNMQERVSFTMVRMKQLQHAIAQPNLGDGQLRILRHMLDYYILRMEAQISNTPELPAELLKRY
jgi:hypothetical protein